MFIYAVSTDYVLVAQFEHATDAVDFVLKYSTQLLPMKSSNEQEDCTRTVFPYLPNDEFCKELIAYKTGVKV